MSAFLDTNVIVRFIAQDDALKAQKVFELFKKVENREIELMLTEAVICETIYVLSSKKMYNFSRNEIRDYFLPIILLKNIKIHKKQVYINALNFYVEHLLDIEDCILVAQMEEENILDIYSYDTDFDQFHHINRKEP